VARIRRKHGDSIEMTGNYSLPMILVPGLENSVVQTDLQNSDRKLRREAARVRKERDSLGQKGLVGSLQAVIINTEPHLQKAAAEELIRYSGLSFQEAFMDTLHKTCVLKVPGSAEFRSTDFLIRSRLKGFNPFQQFNTALKSHDLPNTRLETFVFETSDIDRYVSLASPGKCRIPKRHT
jgi:hypothetical protein